MSAPATADGPAEPAAETDDFADPIEFLYRDHERIRRLCDQLVALAGDLSAPGAAGLAGDALAYMEDGLPQHIADEEEGLFPLLQRRAADDDRLMAVVGLLRLDHQEDIEYGRALLAPLRAIAGGGQPADAAMFVHHVRAFRMLQRRHQATENNIVVPAAFDCLTAADKAELARGMAARRGL